MANPGIFPGAAALMPQQRERTESDWAPRDYWTQPPNVIPPKPPFHAYVPPAKVFAFESASRDLNAYQLQGQILPVTQVLPVPPKPVGVNPPQQNARPDWALRDYNANRDVFSILATPLPPPPNNMLPPQHNARPDWTLRDYSAYQAMSAWFENNPTVNVVPQARSVVFMEAPKDWTVYQTVQRYFTQGSVQSVPPKPHVPDPQINPIPYDYTAQQFSIVKTPQGVLAGIPQVPIGNPFPSFTYLPADMTAMRVALAVFAPPTAAGAQIPPPAPTYLEPPPWTLRDYAAYQDQFSALGTPPVNRYPAGLKPYFPIEALIRDVLHPTTLQTVQVFRVPPPPPRVIPPPPPFIPWREWTLRDYQAYQDMFSALAQGAPIAPGFRVMAVSAGIYAGSYYYPGDVFDIVRASDYSDSTQNYQILSGGYATGWMIKVAPSTPLSQTIVNEESPFFPVVDPRRRTIM